MRRQTTRNQQSSTTILTVLTEVYGKIGNLDHGPFDEVMGRGGEEEVFTVIHPYRLIIPLGL